MKPEGKSKKQRAARCCFLLRPGYSGMDKTGERGQEMNWKALLAGLVLGLAPAFLCLKAARAADADPAKEAADAAQEDEQEKQDRLSGKAGRLKRSFHGTFLLPSDPTQQPNPDVIGTFVTDDADQNPNQTYLVKMGTDNKEILATLQRNDTKKLWLIGKLRNQAKYLIVSGIQGAAPTPPPKDQRSGGGI